MIFCLFRNLQKISAIVVLFGLSCLSREALGQNEYSLDPASNSTNSANTIEDSSVGNFLENEPTSLFGDETEELDTKQSRAALSPNSNHAAKPDVTSVRPPTNSSVTAPSSPAPLVPSIAPIESQPITLPPPAAITKDGVIRAVDQSPAMIPNKSVIVESPIAPLRTDGSLAPVKVRDPLEPNAFSGVPALPGARKNLARGQAPDLYEVERGDTMFDVCSQLIDDGNYWPRLWSLNPEVKNPHFIYPGMRLAFYAGDAQNPPYIEVVQEDDMVPVDKGPLKEAELVAQVDDVPLVFESHSNVAPSSVPAEITGPEGVSDDGTMADIFVDGGGSYTGTDLMLTIPAFIFQEEKQIAGEIVGGEQGEICVGDEKVVRVASDATLSPGGVYTVLRFKGKMDHPLTGNFVGYRYDFAGNIRITSKSSETESKGTVFNSAVGVRPGDVLVSYISTKRTIAGYQVIGTLGASDAAIIGMGLDGQSFAGDGNVVFLDKGGLAQDAYFSIFQKDSNTSVVFGRDPSDESAGRNIGVLRVIDSAANYTVAVIVKTYSEVRLGDRLSAR